MSRRFLGSRGFGSKAKLTHDSSSGRDTEQEKQALDAVTVDQTASASTRPENLQQAKPAQQPQTGSEVCLSDADVEKIAHALDRVQQKRQANPVVESVGALQVTTDLWDKRKAMFGHWLQHAAGGERSLMQKADLGIDMQAVSEAEREDLSLMSIAREYTTQVLGRAPTGRSEVWKHSFVARGDFPLILEDTMNKRLAAMYAQIAPTWTAVARSTTHNDFRDRDVSFGDATPTLEKVIEGGEVRFQGGTEAQESYSIDTYAKGFRVTRQMVIDDDLSFLSRKPNEFARAGITLENRLVWSQICGPAFNNANIPNVQGAALFSRGRSTLGTSDTLNAANIGTAMETMSKKRDRNGNTILAMEYMTLVVPANLRFAATALLELNNYSPDAVDKVIPNYVRNLNLVMEPLLPDSKWYLFGSPTAMDIAEIAYLRGKSSPEIMTETTSDVLGVSYTAVHDVGAKVLDYFGVYRSS